jgi:hypothetical protein
MRLGADTSPPEVDVAPGVPEDGVRNRSTLLDTDRRTSLDRRRPPQARHFR